MEVSGLFGVFLGGALPWLEAVVVIPAGIVAGLQPALVVLAGLTGNLVTVALAAFYGERLRTWWRTRRGRTGPDAGTSEARGGADASARGRRVRQVMRKWGMPGLAFLGPVGLGTQLSAVLAVSMGVSARRAFAWIAGGTVVWCVAAAGLASAGMSFAGIGG